MNEHAEQMASDRETAHRRDDSLKASLTATIQEYQAAHDVHVYNSADLALAEKVEHEITDASDDESEDADPAREDVPAMDGNILQPVEDAVIPPGPASNSHRKEVASRKIAKVRRKKRKKNDSCKAS